MNKKVSPEAVENNSEQSNDFRTVKYVRAGLLPNRIGTKASDGQNYPRDTSKYMCLLQAVDYSCLPWL